MRGSPALFLLAFAPFALMIVWLVRLRLSGRTLSTGKSPVEPFSTRPADRGA